jgi:hypothetical protein
VPEFRGGALALIPKADNFKLQTSHAQRKNAGQKLHFIPWPIVTLAILLLTDMSLGRAAHADIRVFNQVATPGKPFFLKLRTHRGLLAQGGMRAQFWVGERLVGEVLTGADGYGYLKYTATAPGTLVLTARTAASADKARLRVVSATDRAVLFDVEALLWRAAVRNENIAARRVMGRVAMDYELIYICGMMGPRMAGRLIKDRGFPDRIVLSGKDRDQLIRLAHRGVTIHAVAGGPDLVDAARGLVDRRLGFKKRPAALYVRDWDDLLIQLTDEEAPP